MTDRTVAVNLLARTYGFIAGVTAARTVVRGLDTDLKRLAARQQAIRQLGNAAGVMGAAGAAGFILAVRGAANFDQAMSSVQAATRGTSHEMAQLRAAAMKAGADTKYSATEAAGGVEALAKAGVSTRDILNGGLNGALDLAAAGGQSVADAAETAATAMTQFKLAGTDVPHIADLLAAGAGKAQGEVSDMAMALKQGGLVAHQTGLTIEETTGALAAFASQGLIGSDAGTSFKTMLQSLTPTSDKAKTTMHALGIEAYDQQGQFIGLEKFAGRLRRGLADMSEEQRNATLKTIFGSDAVRAAAVIYDQGAAGVRKWTREVNDQGFAAETAATKMDNLNGDLEQLRGSLETALIGTGEGAQGPLRSLTQDVTGLVNAYNRLPDSAQSATLKVTGFLALAGGGAFAFSRLIGGITNIRQSFADMGFAARDADGKVQALTKKTLAVRGGALLAGGALMALSDKAGEADEGLGQITETAGYAAMGFAVGGPWGAAIGGAIGLLKNLGATHITTADDVDALTATLDKQTGAITANSYQWLASKLADAGLIAQIESLGLSTGDVMNAVLEGGPALDALNKKLESYQYASAGAASSGTSHSQAQAVANNTSRALQRSLEDLGVVLVDSRKKWDAASEAELRARIEAHKGIAARQQSATAGRRMGGVLDETTGHLIVQTTETKRHTDATDEDTKALTRWLNKQHRVADALLAQRTDRYALIKAQDDALKSLDKITEGMDAHTKVGQKNNAMLVEFAEQWNSTDKAVQNSAGTYQRQREIFLKMADAMGIGREQAVRMANKFLAVPQVVREARLEHAKQAQDDADKVKRHNEAVPHVDRKATLNIAGALRDAGRLRDGVMHALHDIDNEEVQIRLSAQAANLGASFGIALGRARGGPIPWLPGAVAGKDSVGVAATPDEHFVTAPEVRALGGGSARRGHEVMYVLRRMMLRGELTRYGDLQPHADGGPVVVPRVGLTGLSGAAGDVSSMFARIADTVSARISRVLSDRITDLPATGQLGPGGTLTLAQLARGQAFARAQARKPYLWGGVGPTGYDCSGAQSATLNAALGMYPYRRRGSTGTMPWPGSAPGVGRYTMGWSTNVAGTGIGHTSGNIGGLGVESAGGVGFRVGSAARSPRDGMFHGLMHYDTGGRLKPGTTVVQNDTGRPEHVLTDVQWQALARAFNVSGRMTRAETRSEIRDLIEGLREHLGRGAPLIDRVRRLGDVMLGLQRAQDRASARYERASDRLERLVDRAHDYASSVTGAYRHEPFGGTLGEMRLQLRADRNDADEASRDLARAHRRGLTGGLYRQVAASGNTLLLDQLAHATPQQLRNYSRLFTARQEATRQVGAQAAHVVFGRQIREQNRHLAELRHTVNRLNRQLEHVGDRVHSGALRGTREGMHDRQHRAAVRRKS